MNRCIAITIVCLATALYGCGAKPALRPNLNDNEYASAMTANFQAGMSRAAVESKLDSLGMESKYRHWYAMEGAGSGGTGGQLLQRVFEKGGMWIDAGDQTIEWIDTWFVFAPGGGGAGGTETMTRWYTARGNQRYFDFEPINAPPESQTAGPTRRYPFPPPAPARPPEGAR